MEAMETRLDYLTDVVTGSASKAAEQELWDQFDHLSLMADVLHYIKTGNKPLGTSGIFHLI